jgi:hypothetical protein
MNIIEKTVNIKGNWQRVALSEDEMDEVMGDLLELNIGELKRIKEMVKQDDSLDAEDVRILFERQGIASFTALANALDDKIQKLKDGGYEKPQPIREKKFFTKDDEATVKKLAQVETPNDMDEPDMVAGGDEEPENPFDVGKTKDEYEEVKMPKEKKGRFFG